MATTETFWSAQVARTGDIVAVGGLKDVTTGETLCDDKAPILLERMDFPDPVIKVTLQIIEFSQASTSLK